MQQGRSSQPASRIFGAAVFVLLGPLIWALHLAIVFATHHAACLRGGDERTVVAVVVTATLAAAGVLFAAVLRPVPLARQLRGPANDDSVGVFLESLMRWLAVLSLAGIAWAGSALVFVPVCGR
jgi:hypothetical protein